jgi:hypothetical protein
LCAIVAQHGSDAKVDDAKTGLELCDALEAELSILTADDAYDTSANSGEAEI